MAGEQFGCVTFLMRVARSSQKNTRAFVFEFRRGEDAPAHRFFAKACVERIGILSFDEGAEALWHRRFAEFPVREIAVLIRAEQASKLFAKRVELAERLWCVSLVDDTGANERRVLVLENQKQNVIVKAEQIATDVRLVASSNLGRLGPRGERRFDFGNLVHLQQHVFEATKAGRADQRCELLLLESLQESGSSVAFDCVVEGLAFKKQHRDLTFRWPRLWSLTHRHLPKVQNDADERYAERALRSFPSPVSDSRSTLSRHDRSQPALQLLSVGRTVRKLLVRSPFHCSSF